MSIAGGKRYNTTSKVKFRTVILVITILVIAVSFEIVMQVRNNRKKIDASSTIMAEQIEEQIHSNIAREQTLNATHKDFYIVRAHSVAYMLETNNLYLRSVAKLMTIADVVDVDEINLFDSNGVIIAGTNPEYYGISMDDGEQIGYFKPMLTNRSLDMCQDTQFNTALNKPMMYAAVWSEKENVIVQIGISPERLITELENNMIETIIEDVPFRSGMSVLIADSDGLIMGSTASGYENTFLQDIELYRDDLGVDEMCEAKAVVDGEMSYCILLNEGDYIIAVAQSMYAANQYIAASTLIMLLFLIAAILILIYFVNTAVDNVREQETMYLREVEKERASRLETTINNIMKDALDQPKTSDGIKIVVREISKELGSRACMLYAEDQQMGLSPVNIQWVTLDDGTEEFFDTGDASIDRDMWTWSISTDGNAVLYTSEEIKDIAPEVYERYMSWGINRCAIISFINQYRAIGFMSIIDPNLERMEDIAMVMKQMSKFIISLFKIKAAFDKLTYLGYNDNLTHALNRRALDDRADNIMAGSRFGLVFGDITGLKRINDDLGHDEGDKLIVKAYRILAEEYGKDNVYRVGGDEFVCLVSDSSKRLLNKSVKKLNEVLEDNGVEMSLGCVWTDDYTGDFGDLERNADAEMYNAKIDYYKRHPELKREIFERRQSQELRALIDNLAEAYPEVGTINLLENSFRMIKSYDINREFEKIAKNYDDYIDLILKNHVNPASVNDLKKVVNIENIRKELTSQNKIAFRFQTIKNGWFEITYQSFERDEDGPVKAVFYVNMVSSLIAESLDKELINRNEIEILDGISMEYSIISMIDKKTNKIKVFRYNNFPDEVAKFIGEMTYDEVRLWYAEKFVDDSDVDRFVQSTNLAYIESKFNDNPSFSFIFKTKSSFRKLDHETYAKFYYYRQGESSDSIVFATRDVTSEIDRTY